jgi:glycosyltransferase involved in cell wall biosynthesis
MSSARPAFSIIVPAFNAAATVERCLRSVLDQTFPDFELIVIDDASRDDTVALVSRFSDPRLKLLRSERNGGAAESRNRGLDIARGRLVVFVDADDWIEPTFLAEAHAVMGSATPPDLLITGYRVLTESGTTLGRQSFAGGDPLAGFLEDQMVTALWAKVFRHSIIEQHSIRCPGIKLMEDSAFLAAYMAHVRSVAQIRAPLYAYDTRSGSITSSLSVIDLIEATDQGLTVTADALGSRRSAYRKALRTREFRLLGMQVIRELARSRGTPRADRAIILRARRALRDRLSLRVLIEANLRLSERAAYLLFLAMPSVTVWIVSRVQKARLRGMVPTTSE